MTKGIALYSILILFQVMKRENWGATLFQCTKWRKRRAEENCEES